MTKFGYITVTAVPISHTITASAGGGGTIAPSGAVIVNEGGSQTFTITPNTGFSTASVLVDGVAQVTSSRQLYIHQCNSGSLNISNIRREYARCVYSMITSMQDFPAGQPVALRALLTGTRGHLKMDLIAFS